MRWATESMEETRFGSFLQTHTRSLINEHVVEDRTSGLHASLHSAISMKALTARYVLYYVYQHSDIRRMHAADGDRAGIAVHPQRAGPRDGHRHHRQRRPRHGRAALEGYSRHQDRAQQGTGCRFVPILPICAYTYTLRVPPCHELKARWCRATGSTPRRQTWCQTAFSKWSVSCPVVLSVHVAPHVYCPSAKWCRSPTQSCPIGMQLTRPCWTHWTVSISRIHKVCEQTHPLGANRLRKRCPT